MLSLDFQSVTDLLARIGADPGDDADTRLQKALLVRGSLMFILAGALWGLAYIALGEPLAGYIPLSYALVSLLSVSLFAFTRRYLFFRTSQLILILLLPGILMIALGGFINSSAVIMWSLISPFGALLFDVPRRAPLWLGAYLAMLATSGFLQPHVRLVNNLNLGTITVFFVLNIGAVSTIAFILVSYFIGQKNQILGLLHLEQVKSESLLLNVLPGQVAARLKGGERIIADHFSSASILFADLVGFTPLSARLPPVKMVELLNEIYSHFDSLVDKYGVEKIRTIGDNYMVAAGLPKRRPDHARVLARLALEMNVYLARLVPIHGERLSFRIGINSGPVIAGVIGHKKFSYDVWGDTVNTASRMESQGEPGKIQITHATYELIKDEFVCKPRGKLAIKGKGSMETWFLIGQKA